MEYPKYTVICSYCGRRCPVTGSYVVNPGPHFELQLCGRCYKDYHEGKLRFYPSDGYFGPAVK